MAENEVLANFTLSLEELLVLLPAVGGKSLPGLGEEPLAGVSEDVAKAALGAAERALMARGFLQISPQEKKVTVYTPVLAFLLTAVRPSIILVASVEEEEGRKEARFYYLSKYLMVEHSFPGEGLHRFAGTERFEEIVEALMSFVGVAEGPCLEGEFTLQGETVETLVKLAQEDPRKLQSACQQAGMARQACEALLTALGAPASVGKVYAFQGKEVKAALVVVESGQGQWIVWHHGHGVKVAPSCRARFRSLLEKLIAELP